MRIGRRISAGFGSMVLLLAARCGLGWALATQEDSSTSSQGRAR